VNQVSPPFWVAPVSTLRARGDLRSYPGRVLECVVNLAEGRRPDVLERLTRAGGSALLDVHRDPDHHRAVFTLATSSPEGTEAAVRDLAAAAAEHLSLDAHKGVHPRLGAIDVVPFVALGPTPETEAIRAARDFAWWIAAVLSVPAFLYDLADPDHRTLPEVRRDAFTARAPDAGPLRPHPTLGATAVGARRPLVAINVELDRDDVELARTVARRVRERDGGLPGVRALGLPLESRGHAQVSMNLVDLDVTGLEPACTAVRDAVETLGAQVDRVELVGLVPAAAFERCSAAFLEWSGISANETIEARVALAASAGAASTPDAGPASPA
jgi:glutamate formiminotransferase / 5-formyltetrahydrofolate cyclo-ligase